MAGWKKVVVGLDGSDCSRRALRWAAEEARVHGAEVVAVSTWTPPPPPIAGPYGPPVVWDYTSQPQKATQAQLEALVADELGDAPAVPLTLEVREGNASKVLIDLSHDADVLVVGTRGHGGFAGLLLGSVSQHVCAHAVCSVVVVR